MNLTLLLVVSAILLCNCQANLIKKFEFNNFEKRFINDNLLENQFNQKGKIERLDYYSYNQKNVTYLLNTLAKHIMLLTNISDTDSLARSFSNPFSVNAKTVGNIALASLLTYSAYASMIPEMRNELSRKINSENRQGVQNMITNSLVVVSESLMGWVERSVDDFPSFPRLDAQECMKRCICEAHNQPKKYGLIGLGLQLFFPPYTEADQPTRVVSKYQLAARYGRQDNANCATQYDDCMINLLDIFRTVINMVF